MSKPHHHLFNVAMELDEQPGVMSYVAICFAMDRTGKMVIGRSKAYEVQDWDVVEAYAVAKANADSQL